MTDVNTSPAELPDFPERPDGSDRVEIRIVADRPDPQDDSAGVDFGLAMLEAGLPQAIIDGLTAVGCPRDQIYVQATFIDTEQAPVVRLGEVFPEETEAPVEEPVAEEPPVDPETATEG